MRHNFFILIFIILFFPCAAGASEHAGQTLAGDIFKISGYISCQKNAAPLDGVAIKINGKKKKAETIGGYYELNLAAGAHKIIFSKKGFKDGELILDSGSFDRLQKKMTRNIELAPKEKLLNIKGRLIDRVSGEAVKAQLRINNEIVISDINGYFECETYPGEVKVKVYSKAHRPFQKTFSDGEIFAAAEGLEIFLQRYSLYSIIEGIVLEKKSKAPVYEAVVEIAGKRVLTDNYGGFKIDLNESGEQKLICSREGYKKISQNIKLKTGINKIKIHLDIKEKGLIQQLREKYEKEILY
jgi:hypothetical protein